MNFILRKYILFCSAILSCFSVRAQDTLEFDDYKKFADYVTNNFKQKYPSLTFLKHRLITPELNIFDKYKGALSDSVCNTLDYLALVNDLDISNFLNDPKINLLYIEDRMIENTQNNIIPISLSLIEYNEFKDSAISMEVFDFVNNQYVDNSPSGFYPFKKSILFASCALNQVFNDLQVHFLFKNDVFLTNINISDIDSLYIDFDDGNGYVPLQEFSSYDIQYNSTGTKNIKTKLNYNNTTYYSTSSIIINSPSNTSSAASLPPDRLSSIEAESDSGLPLFGSYGVWFSPCNTSGHIRKPYIISAGFNPGSGKQLQSNSVSPTLNMILNQILISIPYTPFGWNGDWRGTYYETYNGSYNKRFSPNNNEGEDNGNGYLDRLRDEGYDIVIVSYNNGTDLAKNNAALFKKLIKEINIEKSNNGFHFENIVSGYSAGGVATKLALAQMEAEYRAGTGPHPHTKMWVSFETENQGSVVPLGLQYLLDFQSKSKHIFPNISPVLARADLINQVVTYIATGFSNNSTAYELTTYTSAFPGGLTPQRTALLNTFATIPGNSSNGYPEYCRRVGIAQGSATGVTIPHTTPEMFDSKLHFGVGTQTATSIPSSCGGSYVIRLPHAEKYTTARWWGSINPSSPVFDGRTYLDGTFTFQPKICVNLPFFGCKCDGPREIGTVIIIGKKTVQKPSAPFPINYDDVPASTQSAHLEIYSKADGSSSSAYPFYNNFFAGPNSYARRDTKLHAFAPTVSVLDLHDPALNYQPASNFTSPVSLGLMQIGPSTPEPNRSFGFPYINHPNDHYRITPYDAVYALGDNTGTYSNGSAKPSNQFHVEDPLTFIGDYLARIEVAPEDLFLSNRNLAATQNDYIAEFESRNKIFVGNGIYSSQNYPYYLTPDGNFSIDGNSKAIIHAGNEVALLPGTDIFLGAQLDAYIESYNCSNILFSAVHNPNSGGASMNSNQSTVAKSLEEEIGQKQSFGSLALKIYPNPSTGIIIVENYNEDLNSKLTISDLTGKVIFMETINKQINEVNLQSLENGIYMLEITNKNKLAHSKIIISR